MKLQKDLREFIELLNSTGAEYLIVGGYAVAFHGYPRFTGDIDLFIEVSPANVARIIEAMRRFGFDGVTSDDLLKPGVIFQLGRPPYRIDLVTAIDDVTFEEAWKSRVAGNLDGVPVQFIGKEQLLRNKRASARAKDIADVEGMGG